MKENEHYKTIDLPFYRDKIAPILPEKVLDFHAHVWRSADWKRMPWQTDAKGAKYMVLEREYGFERLIADGKKIFPDRPYQAVCFGFPTPYADLDKTNRYSIQAKNHAGMFPLAITGRGIHPVETLRQMILENGFFGYKVFLDWQGDDYGKVSVPDMIGKAEMELADELRLIVLLHVPGGRRLADRKTQMDVVALAKRLPNAKIVLAHCGRCYVPDEMASAIGAIRKQENICLDTSMVMEPEVLKIVFDNVDSKRVLFATDFPVAAMRGRRVYVMDHWVDVVLDGYPPSACRVSSDGIRATFMAYEIIRAVKRGAEMAGVTRPNIKKIFYRNGMNIIKNVKRK